MAGTNSKSIKINKVYIMLEKYLVTCPKNENNEARTRQLAYTENPYRMMMK